jgi:hypothetical protein
MDEAVKSFVNFTGARPDQAKYYLCKAKGDIEMAAGFYFDEITAKAAFQEQVTKVKPSRSLNQSMDEESRQPNQPVNAKEPSRSPLNSQALNRASSQYAGQNDEAMSEFSIEMETFSQRVSNESKKNAFEVISKGRPIIIQVEKSRARSRSSTKTSNKTLIMEKFIL